jgi:DNA modification methylase
MKTTIEYLPPNELKPYLRNSRTHSKHQVRQLAASIERFGFSSPILVDAKSTIVAGHGRAEAAGLLGLTSVPVIRITHLTPDEIRALRLADNRIAAAAGWDEDLLAAELRELEQSLRDDIILTGFSVAEIDIALRSADDDEFLETVSTTEEKRPTTSQNGDVWRIGPHMVACGDARDPDLFARMLAGKQIGAVFTDPPYNVRIQGNAGGRGKIRQREFAMASGEMSPDEYSAFLESVFDLLSSHMSDGALAYACIDWRHVSDMIVASSKFFSLANLCVWVKDNAGMGALYRSQHELVLVLKRGTGQITNNVELGKHGRSRTNVWNYAGATSVGSTRDRALSLHPTVKPVSMISDAIMDCTRRGAIVFDPFLGSGTTIIAAHRTGRVGMGIEIDPIYVDAIIRRIEAATNQKAVLLGTGENFAEVTQKRRMEIRS